MKAVTRNRPQNVGRVHTSALALAQNAATAHRVPVLFFAHEPARFEEFEPATATPLDRGIRRYVPALRSGEVETFKSCEGGEGYAFTEPTIRFQGGPAEGYKAFGVARELELPVLHLRRHRVL